MDARSALRMWVKDGQIDADLAERLEQSLEVAHQSDRSRSLISLFVTVGSVLVGGGLLLFIASHWDEQSPIRRILVLLGVYIVVVAAAWLASRQQLVTTGTGLWFLSSLAVGANIFLAGQIFNLPLNYWHGTLLWLIAALVMGWADSSDAQGWLVVVLGLLTLGWVSVPSSDFFDQSAFLFDEAGIRSLLPLIGLALAAGSVWAADTDFGFLRRPALSVGAVLVAVPLTVSTFHPEVFAELFRLDVRWFHLVVAVLACAIIASSLGFRRTSPVLGYASAILGVLLVGLLPQVGDSGDNANRFGSETNSWLAESFYDSAWLFGLYTAVIFAVALATAAAGKFFAAPALVNAGLAVVGVLCAGVYIGRLAGTLPTSIAVLVGGILLIGGAVFLERKRRDLVGEVLP